jgi:hypothetical protein
MLLLDDVLTWSLSLPTRGALWMVSLIPCIAIRQGDMTSHQAPSSPITQQLVVVLYWQMLEP